MTPGLKPIPDWALVTGLKAGAPTFSCSSEGLVTLHLGTLGRNGGGACYRNRTQVYPSHAQWGEGGDLS